MSDAPEMPDVKQKIRAAGMADVSRKPETPRTARASSTITSPRQPCTTC